MQRDGSMLPSPTPEILTMEVFQVEPIGAGQTPLCDSRVIGNRHIKQLNNHQATTKLIVAPISGDSLKEAGISTGDYAVLKLNFEAYEIREDRLLVIRCPVGLVIKKLSLEGNQVRLISANKNCPDLFFDADQIQVEALVMRVDHTVYELI